MSRQKEWGSKCKTKETRKCRFSVDNLQKKNINRAGNGRNGGKLRECGARKQTSMGDDATKDNG